MNIFKIEIENYRLLRNFSIDLEDELSLVIGKNNTGKTSILSVLHKFLGSFEKNRFSFDDFNIAFKKQLKDLIEDENELLEKEYKRRGIKLRLFISYVERDNLANISRVMMDLDPENNVVVLGFEYILDFKKYVEVRKDFRAFKKKEEAKKKARKDYICKNAYDFFHAKHSDYFNIYRKSLAYDRGTEKVDEDNYLELTKEKRIVSDIINFKYISAKREVANKEIDKTLSGQTSRIYKRTEASEGQNAAVEDFKDRLSETDTHLSDVYKSLFEDIILKVGNFGGVKINESEIAIISTLQHRELLEGNTTVVYKHDADNHLPEHYNGLGYMNLISMIFEIEILLHEFKRKSEQNPADINLLFIEEPEAHTHPQMQYVFIKNIKKLLGKGITRKNGQNRKLQYIISSHSSCIVADSEFDDIKYLKKEGGNGVTARNLKELKNIYDAETTQYQFLKQYLTISRAEIFFADKAVLIEGDTERILIPTLMRKIDKEEEARYKNLKKKDSLLPLLSQNISITEVGAYSQIFEKFIEFLGIKCLVITDIDAVNKNDSGRSQEACKVSDGTGTSNSALKHYFPEINWGQLKYLSLEKRMVKLGAANMLFSFQSEEHDYHARSFEDAFIHINRSYIKTHKGSFEGLKNIHLFDNSTSCAYELAEKCIKKKTHFALDILYHSNEDFSNWKIPAYIKEGLLWLKED